MLTAHLHHQSLLRTAAKKGSTILRVPQHYHNTDFFVQTFMDTTSGFNCIYTCYMLWFISIDIRLEVFAVMTSKRSTFWNVKPCNLPAVYLSFGEAYCHHLRSRRVSQTSNTWRRRTVFLLKVCIHLASLRHIPKKAYSSKFFTDENPIIYR